MNNRITELRSEMKEQNLDAFLVKRLKMYATYRLQDPGLIVITPEHEYYYRLRYTIKPKNKLKTSMSLSIKEKCMKKLANFLTQKTLKLWELKLMI